MARREFKFEELANAEINSIEAMANILGWFLAIGAGQHETEEELDEKIDLVFHCWLPLLNGQYMLYDNMKKALDKGEEAPLDKMEDGSSLYDYKTIPSAQAPLTRNDLISIQNEIIENLDSETNLMFFDQAVSRIVSPGLSIAAIAIANGIADAGDGVDEEENAMIDRMLKIYGPDRGTEIDETDIPFQLALMAVLDVEDYSIREDGWMGQSNREFYKNHYDQLEKIENMQEYNETMNEMLDDWKTQNSGGGACFIATATLGENDYRLSFLRSYRDNYLLKRSFGRNLVKMYYEFGPSLSEFLKKHKVLNLVVKYFFIIPLSKLVKTFGYK